MSKFLVKTTEVYRCDSEKEAVDLIEEAKRDPFYTVSKYNSEIKTVKQKGEIVDEWRRVTITKEFTDEKEPLEQINVIYSNTITNVNQEDNEYED